MPDGDTLGKYPIESWLTSVKDSLPKLTRTPDGRIVLAEITVIVSVDRDHEEESRISVLAHPDIPFQTDRIPDIDTLLHKACFSASDYPNLLGLDSDIPISVVAGGSIFLDAHFLALNPVLAGC